MWMANRLEMDFKPKRKGENTFKGKMLVNIKSFAVRSIEASLSDNVNIGFVHDISFQHDYFPVANSDTSANAQPAWVPQREKLKIKFTSSFVKDAKLIGKKTKSYKSYVVNKAFSDTVFSAYKSTEINEAVYQKMIHSGKKCAMIRCRKPKKEFMKWLTVSNAPSDSGCCVM